MSDPAVVECAAYGISKLRAQQEEGGYEAVVPPVRPSHPPLPPQPTESSAAVYDNPDQDDRVYEQL